MSNNRHHESLKYNDERDKDIESVNCCQLDVHKALIRERKSRNNEYQTHQPDLFGKRSCTDIFCLFTFFVAVIGWIIISVIVFQNGGPQKLLAPVDSRNRRCGYDRGVENRPNVFYFDITKCLPPRRNLLLCDTKQICLSECPKTNFSFSYYLENQEPVSRIRDKLICLDEYKKNVEINTYEDIKNAIKYGFCADWYMESNTIARRCLPKYPSTLDNSNALTVVALPEGGNVEIKGVTHRLILSGIQELKRNEGFIHQVGEDLLKSWPWIIAFIFLAMLISFIYIIVMKWISGIIVWTSMIALIGLLGFTSFYTWKKYAEARAEEGVLRTSTTKLLANLGSDLGILKDDPLKHQYTWLAIFILSVFTLVVILIILLFLRSRLQLAIQLIKEGSRAVSYAWSSLIFPPFPWVLQLLVFVQGAFVYSYLIGLRVPIHRVTGLNTSDCICVNGYKDGDICDIETFRNECHNTYRRLCLTANCAFSENEAETFTIYAHLFNLLMLLWCEYFILGFSQMSLAMTFATYYWTRAERKLPFCIVGISVFRTIQYHLGTIAFGSFLLALLNWVRVLVGFFYRYINKNENSVIRCIKCCCGCLLACLHKILRMLTKNAYIICAMNGTNYCTSANRAFDIIIKNIIRASVLDGVTTFLFLIIKLLITTLLGVMAYFFFSKPVPHFTDHKEEYYQIDYYFVHILIICLTTFFISSLFFGVYSVAVDTIFLCALEDLDRNNGSPEKPFAMRKSLMKIFKVRNRKST